MGTIDDNQLNDYVRKYQDASCEADNSLAKKKIYFDEIYNELIDETKISINDLMDTLYVDAFTDAILSCLENYKSEEGNFRNYFNKVFKCRRMDNLKKRAENHSFICIRGADIPAYREPNEASAVLKKLGYGRTYQIVSHNMYESGIWYEISLKKDNTKIKAYVKEQADIFYSDCSSVSMDKTDDEDDTLSLKDIIPSTSQDVETEICYMCDVMRFIEISLKTVEGKNIDSQDSRKKNELTIYDCYKMFYTEDLIHVLHVQDCNISYSHEREAMMCTNAEWKDYLLVKECNSFDEIIKTPRHDYDYYFKNGNHDEIKLPPEIKIRGEFIRLNMNIDRPDNTLSVSISKNRKKYNMIINGMYSEE